MRSNVLHGGVPGSVRGACTPEEQARHLPRVAAQSPRQRLAGAPADNGSPPRGALPAAQQDALLAALERFAAHPADRRRVAVRALLHDDPARSELPTGRARRTSWSYPRAHTRFEKVTVPALGAVDPAEAVAVAGRETGERRLELGPPLLE
jgi:hypothetical protein